MAKVAKRAQKPIKAEGALEFILGGKALLTLESKTSGKHHTYRINKPKADSPHFVRLLTGPDNTSNFSYMGRITADGQYIHDKRNRAGKADSPAAAGFKWVLYKLQADSPDYKLINSQVRIFHHGKCGKCGRVLTVPESIESGIGPICAGKAVPANRNKNVIRHPKALQDKSRECTVKEATKTAEGFEVVVASSTSGTDYEVLVKDGQAMSCTCEWGGYRPGADKRSACSHAQCAMNWVEETEGRTLSFWPTESDAQRQHRPARHVGDGVVVTSRQVNSMLQNPVEKAKIVAANLAELEAEAALDLEFARLEIEQDQAAEEAKMEFENSMVNRLMARAG